MPLGSRFRKGKMAISGKVFVLDGEQRASLAVIRSLVRGGAEVSVCSHERLSLGAAAHGISDFLQSVNPSQNVVAYENWLNAKIGNATVIPITDVTAMLARAEQDEGYEQLSNKASLLNVAALKGVPAPLSIVAENALNVRSAADRIGFPIVLKPARSKIRIGNGIVATSVRLARSQQNMESYLAAANWIAYAPLVVQQFIPGHGAGVFCLYDRDHAIAWFAHRRIREKPPSGGVSVLCESVAVDPVLKDYAERLLRAAEYRGVAMVEFRIGTDGRPYLMEVNARFWGSLQLAIDCGVDFPWLYYQMLMGESVAPVQEYQVGRRLRWWLGDLDHVLLQIRNPDLGVGQKLAVVGRFLGTSFDPRCRQEVFRWSDPGPGWLELRQWVAGVLGRSP